MAQYHNGGYEPKTLKEGLGLLFIGIVGFGALYLLYQVAMTWPTIGMIGLTIAYLYSFKIKKFVPEENGLELFVGWAFGLIFLYHSIQDLGLKLWLVALVIFLFAKK